MHVNEQLPKGFLCTAVQLHGPAANNLVVVAYVQTALPGVERRMCVNRNDYSLTMPQHVRMVMVRNSDVSRK